MFNGLRRPLVFTNGVFDLLHQGHITCLTHARRLGASLIVAVNGDASVRRLGKGPERPIECEDVRASAVAALPVVSAVVLFDENTPLTLIRALRPDIYVKGGDYQVSDLPEAQVVAQWGGQTIIIPRVPGWSTTLLLEQRKRQLNALSSYLPTPSLAIQAMPEVSFLVQRAL